MIWRILMTTVLPRHLLECRRKFFFKELYWDESSFPHFDEDYELVTERYWALRGEHYCGNLQHTTSLLFSSFL